ncbi:MAG: HAD family hydrolase [Acidobacteria bacterium]|nr:HAD family hydrolase [Acidobacteriota bacterium]MCA1637563.1 HAD family hydrolase [Acidobacteriota bacterium]
MNTDKSKNPKSIIQNPKSKAVFIDRDGTLIEEVDFLSRIEDLQLFSYTAEAVQLLKEDGFLIIVVTNQSGIARKIFNESEMHAIHEKIQAELDGKIDAFYFCPHLPNAGCLCRKPNIEMIEKACADFLIDLENSWMIGDKKLDIETGFNAGTKTALVLTGYGEKTVVNLEKRPNLIAENLLEAVKLVVSGER